MRGGRRVASHVSISSANCWSRWPADVTQGETAHKHRRRPPPPCGESHGYPKWPTYKIHGRLRPAFRMVPRMLPPLARLLPPDIEIDRDFRPMASDRTSRLRSRGRTFDLWRKRGLLYWLRRLGDETFRPVRGRWCDCGCRNGRWSWLDCSGHNRYRSAGLPNPLGLQPDSLRTGGWSHSHLHD
jgi:hypothetical protein